MTGNEAVIALPTVAIQLRLQALPRTGCWRSPPAATTPGAELLVHVRQIHADSRRTYGVQRGTGSCAALVVDGYVLTTGPGWQPDLTEQNATTGN